MSNTFSSQVLLLTPAFRFSTIVGTLLMDWRVRSFPDMQEYTNASPSLPTSLHQPADAGHASFLETSVGSATLHLVMQMNNASSSRVHPTTLSGTVWKPCARFIQDAVRVTMQEHLDEDGCEVLYGRAGFLYAILLLRQKSSEYSTELRNDDPVFATVSNIASDQNISALVEDIIRRGVIGAQSYVATLSVEESKRAPPLMWSWHGKRYLGGAHGLGKYFPLNCVRSLDADFRMVAGILQMLASAPKYILKPHWHLVLGTLRWLLEVQLPSGNWPSKAGRRMYDGEDEVDKYQLVQYVDSPYVS